MDLALIQWMTAVTAVVCVITIAILRRMDPEEPSLRLWMIAVGLLACANLLGGLRQMYPTPLVIISHNVVGVVGGIYLVQALRVLMRMPRGPQVQWVVGGAYFVFATWFTVIDPQTDVRMVVGTLFAVLIFGYCSWLLYRFQEPGLNFVLRLASVIAAAVSILYTAVAVLFLTSNPPPTPVPTGPAVTVTYMASGAVWTTVTLLLAYVVATRMHIRLAEAKEAVDEANLKLLESTWIDSATQVTNRSRIASLLSSGLESNANFGVPLTPALVSLENSSLPALDPRTVDPVMARAAEVLKTALGISGPDFETIGRWGDDAFLVLLHGLSRHESIEVAQRMATALKAHCEQAGWNSYRIGVTTCAPGDTAEAVLDRLYEATYAPSEQTDYVRMV